MKRLFNCIENDLIWVILVKMNEKGFVNSI